MVSVNIDTVEVSLLERADFNAIGEYKQFI